MEDKYGEEIKQTDIDYKIRLKDCSFGDKLEFYLARIWFLFYTRMILGLSCKTYMSKYLNDKHYATIVIWKSIIWFPICYWYFKSVEMFIVIECLVWGLAIYHFFTRKRVNEDLVYNRERKGHEYELCNDLREYIWENKDIKQLFDNRGINIKDKSLQIADWDNLIVYLNNNYDNDIIVMRDYVWKFVEGVNGEVVHYMDTDLGYMDDFKTKEWKETLNEFSRIKFENKRSVEQRKYRNYYNKTNEWIELFN